MLHFLMLFSSRYPFTTSLWPLFSVTSVPSALKATRSPIAEFRRAAHQPNRFPLFPHPVNIEHAGTPANPSPSAVYFTTSVYPAGGGPAAPCIIFKTAPTPVTPLDATLTKKRGLPRASLAPPFLAIHYTPPTTHRPHQSATLSLRGTHDPL
jgi:hypothetical protein